MSSRLFTVPQLSRTLITFAAVGVAYGAYTLFAVPFIEPVAKERPPTPEEVEGEPTGPTQSRHHEVLASFFPDPGAWQRQNPKMVETESSVLLLKDYRTLDDGRMEIKPCTLLFIQKNQQPRSDGHPGRVVVLDAPDGAILQFDEDVDLRRGEFGRLVGGTPGGRSHHPKQRVDPRCRRQD